MTNSTVQPKTLIFAWVKAESLTILAKRWRISIQAVKAEKNKVLCK